MKGRIATIALLLPALLSVLLIAAHFSRAGLNVVAGLCLALPLLLLVRRRWVARLFQGLLLLAALEWARTAVVLTMARTDLGYPWGRLALILGLVTLFTLGSIFVFRSERLSKRYHLLN
jgi:hypothetical protein